jgi:hypothetical protein
MVWDYMDGSTPPPPPPPPPPPVTQWNPNDANPPSQVSGPQSSKPTPPPVPAPNSGPDGQTVVNTVALDTFASNISQLIGPVKDAYNKLQQINPLQIGKLYESSALENKINSSGQSASGGGSGGLVDSYIAVLDDLANGLQDIYNTAAAMSLKYTTADELNGMSVTDLQNALNSAQGSFGNMMTANGGSPSSPAGGSSQGGGSGGSGGSGG